MATKLQNLLPLFLIGTSMVIFSAHAEYHCGRQQSCYMLPAECAYGTCDYEVVWSLSEDETKLNLKIAAETEGWVAVGFSDDQRMENNHVLMCMKTGNSSAKFEHRYNRGRENFAETTNHGITVNEINYSDGKVSCRLERNISVISGGKEFDILENDYYMFFARGKLVNGMPVKHTAIPPVTSRKVNFTDIVVVDAMSPTEPPAGDDDPDSATVKQGGLLLVLLSMLVGMMASNL